MTSVRQPERYYVRLLDGKDNEVWRGFAELVSGAYTPIEAGYVQAVQTSKGPYRWQRLPRKEYPNA